MAILSRVKRLFQADIHALLDAMEEPESVLKQALREMQEALDLKKTVLARNQAALSNLKRNEADLVEELQAAERDLEFSLREASEEVGRQTVARKLSVAKRLKRLQQRVSELQNVCEKQSQEIEAQQGQLDSMMEKAKAFVPIAADDSALAVAESILSARETTRTKGASAEVSEEEIELEWLRLRPGDPSGGQS